MELHRTAQSNWAELQIQLIDETLNEVVVEVARKTVAIREYETWLAENQQHQRRGENRLAEARDQSNALRARVFKTFRQDSDDVNSWRFPIKTTRWIEGYADRFYLRLVAAMVGGLSLIIPMLIMALNATLLTAIVVTTSFVLSVGTAMALVMDAPIKNILSASAAYAAVLVVFVGTSLPTTTEAG